MFKRFLVFIVLTVVLFVLANTIAHAAPHTPNQVPEPVMHETSNQTLAIKHLPLQMFPEVFSLKV